MNVTDLISEAQCHGISFRVDGDQVLVSPRSSLNEPLLSSLRERRPQIFAVLKVREVLSGGHRLLGRQLRQTTELSTGDLYWALGVLYEEGTLKTDPSGVYWLEEVVH